MHGSSARNIELKHDDIVIFHETDQLPIMCTMQMPSKYDSGPVGRHGGAIRWGIVTSAPVHIA